MSNRNIPTEYKTLAESFAEKVAKKHNEIAVRNTKIGESAAQISMTVTHIEKPRKPRANGDLRIQFKIEGHMKDRVTLMAALNSVADNDAAPRSFTSVQTGFVTHMKPQANLF